MKKHIIIFNIFIILTTSTQISCMQLAKKDSLKLLIDQEHDIAKKLILQEVALNILLNPSIPNRIFKDIDNLTDKDRYEICEKLCSCISIANLIKHALLMKAYYLSKGKGVEKNTDEAIAIYKEHWKTYEDPVALVCIEEINEANADPKVSFSELAKQYKLALNEYKNKFEGSNEKMASLKYIRFIYFNFVEYDEKGKENDTLDQEKTYREQKSKELAVISYRILNALKENGNIYLDIIDLEMFALHARALQDNSRKQRFSTAGIKCLLIAANTDICIPDAINHLAFLYLFGIYLEKDYDKALFYLNKIYDLKNLSLSDIKKKVIKHLTKFKFQDLAKDSIITYNTESIKLEEIKKIIIKNLTNIPAGIQDMSSSKIPYQKIIAACNKLLTGADSAKIEFDTEKKIFKIKDERFKKTILFPIDEEDFHTNIELYKFMTESRINEQKYSDSDSSDDDHKFASAIDYLMQYFHIICPFKRYENNISWIHSGICDGTKGHFEYVFYKKANNLILYHKMFRKTGNIDLIELMNKKLEVVV